MTTPLKTFEQRKTLDDLVHELVASFVDHSGKPAGHVCRPTRYQRCVHDEGPRARQSLLARLRELVNQPGITAPAADDGGAGSRGSSSKKAPAGSPAPWAAAPAELVDEILRGATELQGRCRVALGLREVPEADTRVVQLGSQLIRVSLPAHELGYRALSCLPGLALELRRAGHPLGVLELPDGRLRPGRVEVDVRRWHTRAVELLGYEVPWERLPPIENPDVVAVPGVLGGPVCWSPACGHESCARLRVTAAWGHCRVGPVCRSCSHTSCARVRRRRQRLLPWICPWCDADSLRVHPVTGIVRCMRPSCTLQEQSTEWQLEELEAGADDPWGDLEHSPGGVHDEPQGVVA